MFQRFHAFAHIHNHAEFLVQFSLETFGKRFAGLAFAAGKFPQTGQMPTWRTLGDKQFTTLEQKSCCDHHRIVHGRKK